jgi:hypothetical protein
MGLIQPSIDYLLANDIRNDAEYLIQSGERYPSPLTPGDVRMYAFLRHANRFALFSFAAISVYEWTQPAPMREPALYAQYSGLLDVLCMAQVGTWKIVDKSMERSLTRIRELTKSIRARSQPFK